MLASPSPRWISPSAANCICPFTVRPSSKALVPSAGQLMSAAVRRSGLMVMDSGARLLVRHSIRLSSTETLAMRRRQESSCAASPMSSVAASAGAAALGANMSTGLARSPSTKPRSTRPRRLTESIAASSALLSTAMLSSTRSPMTAEVCGSASGSAGTRRSSCARNRPSLTLKRRSSLQSTV